MMELNLRISNLSNGAKSLYKCQIWKLKRLFYDKRTLYRGSSSVCPSALNQHSICEAILGKKISFGAILYLLVTLLQASSATAQVTRPFPEVYNIAENRPVVSNPSDSACGVPTRNAYCESTVYPISVQQCTQLFCVQICPNRTALPPFVDLLISTSPGLGSCVVTDTVNTYPNSRLGEFSTFFVQAGPFCYATPSTSFVVGANGAFTITFWVWQETSNNG